MTRGRIGSRGLSSQLSASDGLSTYMRHSRTENFVILKYLRIGAIETIDVMLWRDGDEAGLLTFQPCQQPRDPPLSPSR